MLYIIKWLGGADLMIAWDEEDGGWALSPSGTGVSTYSTGQALVLGCTCLEEGVRSRNSYKGGLWARRKL